MTARDAFAIAFDDEVVAMDAMPGNDMPKNTLPNKPSAPSGLKKNAATAPGADTSSTGDKSLAQHLEEGCQAMKNGHPEKCPYIKKMAADLEQSQGLDHNTAMQQAIGMHADAANKLAGGQAQQPQNQVQPTTNQPQQPMQPANPEIQEAEAQQLAQQGAQAVLNKLESETKADQFPEPKKVETSSGTLTAETVGQEAAIIVSQTNADQGGKAGENALDAIKEAQEDGTITKGGEQPPDVAQGGQAGMPEQQEDVHLTSANGEYIHTLSDNEKAILQAHPDKQELLQRIVDAEGKFQATKDPVEQQRLNDGLKMLKGMFYGKDGENRDTTTSSSATPTAPGDADTDSGTTPPSPPGGGGSNPPNPPNNPPDDDDDDSRRPLPKAPSDEEFRVGKNKYKVGGVVYTDVSGKGLFRTALASFMAGLRGEGVITGWDRISGTWDAMKRSEKGEFVRDGIAAALCNDTISKYANKEGLSEDARMEIANIVDMMEQAETPEERMKVIKQFQQWKDKYAKELGELDKPTPGQTFKPLPNDYKGTKPPVSILKKSEGFEADKEFGDKVAAGLQERLGILGFQIEGLAGVSVGPSATTVRFKVPPTFDITAANSKKTRESLKGAIGGTEVSSVEYAKGEKDVIAITVTNPEMRNVAFSDVINSQRWKTFAKKAALPIPLGRDSSGEETMLDAATMPQTIVTGATGSGKSVFISAAINGIEMEKTPDEARIVLLDPKNEFKIQDGSPHLLFPRAGGDPDKAKASKDMADVLDSLVAIMNERVTKIGGVMEGFDPNKNEFKGAAEHSIKQYNEAHPDDKMPHILLVFDEIANARDNATPADKARIDLALQKLTAIGRSVGVNCLLATQRDDVGSIPGIIQANCPGRVTFKASPTDAKASQEAKALAGNGDYILTDKGGNKTRGRGCFISREEEMAIPSYYRDHMAGADTPNEPTLPKEYTDGIAQAVKNKQPISVQAIEGMEDLFKKSLPDGWTVENEKVDGDDHWKAVPPKPTRVDLKDAKKPKKITKVDDVDATVDWEDVNSIKDYVKRLEDAAKEVGKGFKGNQLKERAKAMAPFTEQIEELNRYIGENFPDSDLEDGDEVQSPDNKSTGEFGGQGGSEQDTPEEPQWESPLTRALKPENRIAEAQKRYEEAAKELQKHIGAKNNGITPQQFNAELKKLDDEYNDYISQVKAGKSDDEIYSAREEAHKKEEAQKKAELDKKKALVRTTALKNPKRKIVGATNIMESYGGKPENIVPMPKGTLSKIKLPDGFELDTDMHGKPVMALDTDGKMYGYARHQDGSWGRIDTNGVFHPRVNTSSPDILGEDHPQTQKAKKRWTQNKDKSKDEQLRKDYYLKAYGVEAWDEAPDNMTIVANAVMDALKIMEGKKV